MQYKLIKQAPIDVQIGYILEEREWESYYHMTPRVYPGWFEEVKEPPFKVGDWVVVLTNDYCSYRAGDVHRINNITSDDRLNTDNGNGWTFEHFRLATDKEIETHLIAEAKKRYPIGTKVKSALRHSLSEPTTVRVDAIGYISIVKGRRILWNIQDGEKYGFLYDDGQWAEIVKEEEPIVIADYEAKFDGGGVGFGCKSYSKSEVNELIRIMERFEIGSVAIPSVNVVIDLQTIRKIRDRIK